MRICEYRINGCTLGEGRGNPSPGYCRLVCRKRIDPVTPDPVIPDPTLPRRRDRMPVRPPSRPAPDTDRVKASELIERGLGSELESFFQAIGVDKAARLYESLTGGKCGCDARKKWLNAKFPNGIRGLFGL